MYFHMYIAQGRGRQHIGNKILMTTERPFLFVHMLQVSKWSLRNLILYTFLMILYIYIAPGQGYATPWGQIFDVSRTLLSLCPFVAHLKKEIWFYTHFKWFYICMEPWGNGRQPFGDKLLMSIESPYHFSRLLQVKINCFEVRFYIHFFHVSPYVYSPGQGQTIHWGQNFDETERPFLFAHTLQVSKWSFSKSDFIYIFDDFIHVYSTGARAENPSGTNFWCQQKALITSTICCKFRTNPFEFWFYTHFLMLFHMYIALGQVQTTLCGQNPDVNRKALSLFLFVASF